MVGDMEKDKAMLEAVSPANHADKIKTPLFIAQGAKDPRVKFYKAMEKFLAQHIKKS